MIGGLRKHLIPFLFVQNDRPVAELKHIFKVLVVMFPGHSPVFLPEIFRFDSKIFFEQIICWDELVFYTALRARPAPAFRPTVYPQ